MRLIREQHPNKIPVGPRRLRQLLSERVIVCVCERCIQGHPEPASGFPEFQAAASLTRVSLTWFWLEFRLDPQSSAGCPAAPGSQHTHHTHHTHTLVLVFPEPSICCAATLEAAPPPPPSLCSSWEMEARCNTTSSRTPPRQLTWPPAHSGGDTSSFRAVPAGEVSSRWPLQLSDSEQRSGDC